MAEKVRAENRKTVDMTKGNPVRLMLAFAVPLFIGNIFQMFYNMVDTMVVGRFVGTEALAAVGGSASSYNMMLALVLGFTNGGSVLLSQAFGGGDKREMRKCFASAFLLIMATGAAFSIIGEFLALPMLRLLKTPDNVIDGSVLYLRVMFAGILATSLYNGMSSFLRALGNSRTPLVALIAASVLNIILDLLFVIVFHWDIAGVAAATVISQAVSGFYCLIYAWKNIPDLRLTGEDLHPEKRVITETLRLGVPAAFSSVGVNISVMFIQRAVNAYGSAVMAAYVAANKTENLFFCLSFAMGMAVGVYCGQNRGAGEMERVREGLFTGIRISVIYHLVITTILLVLGGGVIRIFSEDPEVISVGAEIVRITAVFAPVLGVLFIFQHFLRSMSDVRPTVYMSFAEIFARAVLPFVLSSSFGYYGIWWATPIGWSLSLLIGVLRYRTGKWKDAMRVEEGAPAPIHTPESESSQRRML